MKIKQSKSDAVIKGFMLFLYQQPFIERMKWCSVVARKGKRENFKYLYACLCVVSFLSAIGLTHIILTVIKLFK